MHPGWRFRWHVWDGRTHHSKNRDPQSWDSAACCFQHLFFFTLILNHQNDELKKCHVIWSSLYCIYRKQIICSLRTVETEYDELIRKKCSLGVTEKLVFYTAVTSYFLVLVWQTQGYWTILVPAFRLGSQVGLGRRNFHAEMWLQCEYCARVREVLFNSGFIQCIKSGQSLLLISA